MKYIIKVPALSLLVVVYAVVLKAGDVLHHAFDRVPS